MQRTATRLPRGARRGGLLLVLAALVLVGALVGMRTGSAPPTRSPNGADHPVGTVPATATPPSASAPRVHPAALSTGGAAQESLPGGRDYLLLAHRGTPAPLLVALHGYLNTPEDLEKASGLAGLARAEGFTLVYGEGVHASWNAGFACCGVAAKTGVDDVRYLSDVIADASRRADVDPARIWLIGFSDGGMLAARAACDLPEVAAAVSVAGPLLVPCARPVNLLHIHGTEDRVVPLHGGFSSLTQSTFPDSTGEGARLPRGSDWRLVLWQGSHAWPGPNHPAPVGTPPLDATRVALAFLQQHHLTI